MKKGKDKKRRHLGEEAGKIEEMKMLEEIRVHAKKEDADSKGMNVRKGQDIDRADKNKDNFKNVKKDLPKKGRTRGGRETSHEIRRIATDQKTKKTKGKDIKKKDSQDRISAMKGAIEGTKMLRKTTKEEKKVIGTIEENIEIRMYKITSLSK